MSSTTSDLLHLLHERGFVHQCTDADGLREALSAGAVSAYLGFDATADSLHIGHLQGLMLMRWLQRAGHQPILLIGGATTRIGDPSFRDSSRPVLDETTIATNIAGICTAFDRYLGVSADVILTHLAEVKLTHLGKDGGFLAAGDVDSGASSGNQGIGTSGCAD